MQIVSSQAPNPDADVFLVDKTVNVVGQLCTPNDVIAREVRIEFVKVGDVLVFEYAGAYAWNISHHDFLSHPAPEICYLFENKVLEFDKSPRSACKIA